MTSEFVLNHKDLTDVSFLSNPLEILPVELLIRANNKKMHINFGAVLDNYINAP